MPEVNGPIIMSVHFSAQYSNSKTTFGFLFTTSKETIKGGGGNRGNMRHGIYVLIRNFSNLSVENGNTFKIEHNAFEIKCTQLHCKCISGTPNCDPCLLPRGISR
jgi:hypothetical protein